MFKYHLLQIAQEQPPTAVRTEPPRPLEGDSRGLMGSSVNWVGTQSKATWSVSHYQNSLINHSLVMFIILLLIKSCVARY